MSGPAAPAGGTRGPRQAPGPRSAAAARGAGGARGPGDRRSPRRASAPGYAARELDDLAVTASNPSLPASAPLAAAVPAGPPSRARAAQSALAARAMGAATALRAGAAGTVAALRARTARSTAALRAGAAGAGAAPGRWRRGALDGLRDRRRDRAAERERRRAEEAAVAPEPPGELSGLRLLLDQIDAMLRDPTLARALRRFTDRLGSGVRDLLRAIRLPRLRLPHLPRWLLLPLLALLLGLASIALLSSGGDDRGTRAGPAAAAGRQTALAGVGMPRLAAAPDDPPPARVALVVGDAYSPAALRHELRSLGTWLAANHAPGTRVSLIDAATGRASAPLSAAALADGADLTAQPSVSAAIRDALAGGGRRLLVRVGAPAPPSAATALTIATRRGATASPTLALRRGGRARVAIDDRRPDALAASVARALVAISGQRERP